MKHGIAAAQWPALLGLWLLWMSESVRATPFDVSIDTSNLQGVVGTLAFDFISANSASDAFSISGFSTDGTLGASSSSGSVSGSLAETTVLGGGSAFFNELLQGETLGTRLNFSFDFLATAVPAGGTPDEFSFFLLDSSALNSLVTTSDPTGASALLTVALDGSAGGSQTVYDAQPPLPGTIGAGQPVSVPEPSLAALFWVAVVTCIGAQGIRQVRRDAIT
jgi:hypothetical protein